MRPAPDPSRTAQRLPSQTAQRVKVGVIGLAAVVLLIAIASAIIGTAARAPGNAPAGVVANLQIDNGQAGEPLAELGAAPGTANEQDAPPR